MSPRRLAFWTDGEPQPQGSKTAFIQGGRAQVVDANPGPLKLWRKQIVVQAERSMLINDWATIPKGTPCRVVVQLWLPRPAKHYRTGRYAHLLRDDAPAYPTYKKDLDKLIRAVYDALTTAKVYEDDGQVVEGGQSKNYCSNGIQPGAHITVYSLEGMTQNL